MLIRLPDLVARSARRNPGAPALTARTTTISYADLHERTELAAAGLRDLGLEGGERVAVFLDKRIETVVALLGLLAGRWRVRPGESRAAAEAGRGTSSTTAPCGYW